MDKVNPGAGKNVPPIKSYVVIYFLEKGASEALASEFFDEYSGRKWLNSRMRLIKNWKEHAWTYIWYGTKKGLSKG